MAQCFLFSKWLGQPPVAIPSHRDTLLHVKEAQIAYPPFLDIVILNSDFNNASSTPACSMVKSGRPAKAVWEHFVKVKTNGKTVARFKFCGHQMSPKCNRMLVHHTKCSNNDSVCYNYTTMDIRNNKYKEQFDQVQ